jgi:translation initiation factor 2D
VNNAIYVCVVYTTWQHPDMLPILYTWTPVIQKLIEGAGLYRLLCVRDAY